MTEIKRNEPMRNHTSFKIGGPVSELWLPKSNEELAETLRTLRARGVPPLIFGNGTNLLVSDSPLNIAAVKTVPALGELELIGETSIRASCGVTLARLASFAAENSLSGLEFAHGIPGSVGGAVFMNAGAYGGEIGNSVRSVTVLCEDGEIAELTRGQCGFSYRHSVFGTNNATILSAVFDLSVDNPGKIRDTMQKFAASRREKQPLEYPSAGSAFKRPPPKNGEPQYAAAMIDEAGLRGFRVGGAAVSGKHAGFIVNLGGAAFGDVIRVIEHVQSEVFKRFGVELEPEIRIIK